jgi:hypothetical protein
MTGRGFKRKSRQLISTLPSAELPPTQLPPGDALEPGPLKIVSLAAPFGRRPLGQQPLEDPSRDPDHVADDGAPHPFA